jgi:hypothetical protein
MKLKQAVGTLLEIVSEFDFLERSDKSRAIAAILSPAFKPGEVLKVHFPLFVFEADESQAGKDSSLNWCRQFTASMRPLSLSAKAAWAVLTSRYRQNWLLAVRSSSATTSVARSIRSILKQS